MIVSFKHKGLKRLYEKNDRKGIHPEHIRKVIQILTQLHDADCPEDMALPAFRLHPLSGNLAGFWSVTVRANWRIIFRFDGQNVADVELIDYH